MTTEIRHPEINVKMVGEDGNVFAIIGRVDRALKKAGVGYEERDEFAAAAFVSDSYDHVLRLVMRWVSVS